MKAIFVVQGEGRGHLTQALSLKKILEDNGHEVVDVMVGKSKNREIPTFFKEKIGMELTTFRSPNFIPSKDNRQFNLLTSAAYNTLHTPSYLKSIFLIRKHIKQSGADIVINFYEILCGLACSLLPRHIPEVCIAHQYMFLHPEFHMPEKQKGAEAMLRLFTKATALGTTAKLALSIRQIPDCREEHIKVVPPLLREDVKREIRRHGDYIMGYILNPGFYDDVMKWHKENPSTKLHFFWDKKGAPEELHVDDTLTFHAINDERFLHYMAGCKAFATTAGFESVCEALYMGKPAMMIPVHVEQMCNATDAEKEMAGIKSDSFDMSRLQDFAHEYEEDIEFRMWENTAETRIMAAIRTVYDNYYITKENVAYEKDDSTVAVDPGSVLAGYAWHG